MPVTIKKGITSGALSLTPLVDIVFLLLIFFLVSSRFEEEEREMAVSLPQASAAEPTISPQQELFVTVTAGGEYYLLGQQHTPESLEHHLRAIYHTNPGRQQVTIRADKASRTANLVAVMNACNQANIRNYTVATE